MPPDADPDIIELEILDPTGAKTTEGGSVSAGFVPATLGFVPIVPCMVCALFYYTTYISPELCRDEYFADFCPDYDCPDKRGGGPTGFPAGKITGEDLEILGRYRDEVLAASPGGDYYIALYEDYSADVMAAVVREPTLFHRVAEVQELWVPAIAAQVDGAGASFIITADMQAALLDLMGKLETHGSPDLAQLVADFRTELDLENIAGNTAADLQDALDNNSMPVERSSWSGVKALFKEGQETR
jgi:hypothetical protein